MRIKLINLNLYEGGLLFDKILEFLKLEKPDILTLQEVYNGEDPKLPDNFRSLQVLKQQLKGFHFFFSPELLDNLPEGKIEQGNAIFSRFPIIDKQTFFLGVSYDSNYIKAEKKGDFSNDPKNLQQITIKVNDIILDILNIHGIWGLDGADNSKRLAMGQIIVDRIEKKDRVILAGDFNLKPNTKTIQNIEKRLKNVFRGELTTTFNVKRKDRPGYATAVVDMIFVSNGLKVTEHYCPKVDISDHLPLVCVLDVHQ